MATRCNHLIVVLTEEFLKSRENTYLVNFTQKLQIGKHFLDNQLIRALIEYF